MDIIFGEVELYLPKTIEAIVTARNLLSLVEEEIVNGWVCKHCGCTENMPCLGGCSWVAPNLCSRCAEKEKSKPEKNASQLWAEEAHKKYVAREEADKLLQSSSVERVKEATLEDSDILPEDNRARAKPGEPKSDTHDNNGGIERPELRCPKKLKTCAEIAESVPYEPQSKEIQNTQNDVKCPRCGKSDYSKWGTKKIRAGTKYQYYCKPCGKVFSSNLDVGRKIKLWKRTAIQTQSQIKDQLLNDPDRAYKPFGLNRLTKTGGDGEKIEQVYIDELAAPGANA